MSRITGPLAAVSSKPGCTPAARSTKSHHRVGLGERRSVPAASATGVDSEGTATIRLPGTLSPSRLVARMRASSDAARIASARSLTADTTCSQLSSTSSSLLPTSHSSMASRGERCAFKTPNTVATASSTRAPSLSGAEIDPPHAARKAGPRLLGHVQRQPCLAAAAHAGERHHAGRLSSALEPSSSSTRPTKLVRLEGSDPGNREATKRAPEIAAEAAPVGNRKPSRAATSATLAQRWSGFLSSVRAISARSASGTRSGSGAGSRLRMAHSSNPVVPSNGLRPMAIVEEHAEGPDVAVRLGGLGEQQLRRHVGQRAGDRFVGSQRHGAPATARSRGGQSVRRGRGRAL